MNAGRRRSREGRGETTRLNRWRRRLAESMPSPGPAQPGWMPSRDRGRRAQGTGDRSAAVAEVCFVDSRWPEGRHNESPPPAGGRLEAGRGTRGGDQKPYEFSNLTTGDNKAFPNAGGTAFPTTRYLSFNPPSKVIWVGSPCIRMHSRQDNLRLNSPCKFQESLPTFIIGSPCG